MNQAGMIKIVIATLLFSPMFLTLTQCKVQRKSNIPADKIIKRVELPKPAFASSTSIEEALLKRRSHRDFNDEALQLKEISQLLWAAQGITDDKGRRTAPSAGALYPLEVYLVNGNVISLSPGVYHYQASNHILEQITEGSKQTPLSFAALMQGSINRAAAVLVITADYERTMRKYSERGRRFVYMEAGHAAQNICLQAVSLKMGAVTVGAFNDSLVKRYLNLPLNEDPLYLIPIGKL